MALNGAGAVIVYGFTVMQPLPSITVAEYEPGHMPPIVDVFKGLPDQVNVYVGVPPEATCVAVALHELEQETFSEVNVLVNAVGWVNVTVLVAVQPLLSVTITVYVFGHNARTVDVMAPPNPPTGIHE